MVIGNQPELTGPLLGPGASIGSVLVHELADAAGPHRGALAALALLLVALSLGFSLLARVAAAPRGAQAHP
jgi:ABC-type phosphate transport system permease subunit